MKRGAVGPISLRGAGPQERFLVLVLAVLAIACAGLLLWRMNYFAGDFRNNLWAPARLLVRGESPYRFDGSIQENYAVWFPQVVGLFFWLGWLDLRLAANLWFVGSAAIALVLIRWYREAAPAALTLLAISLTLIFPPTFFHFLLGQYDLLAMLLLLLAVGLVSKGRYLWAGLLLAPTLGKPQLVLLALPGLWIVSLRRGRLRGALLFPAAVLLGSALLTVPLWVVCPGWVPDFLAALQHNPDWFQPTLYTMLELWGGAPWKVVPGLLSLALFALNLWLWWKYPPAEVLPWSLALTTLASPYMWTWDFILFLPLIYRSLYRQRSRITRLIWGLGYLLCWALLIWLLLALGESVHWHFWLPGLFLALVLGTHAVESLRAGVRWLPLLRRPERNGNETG